MTKQIDPIERRTGNLTILQLMASLAILGIFVWCAGRWWLG